MKLCPGARLGISLVGDLLTFYGDEAGLLALASFVESPPYWDSSPFCLDEIDRYPPDLERRIEVVVKSPRNQERVCHTAIMDTETPVLSRINVMLHFVPKDLLSNSLETSVEEGDCGLDLNILAPAELFSSLVWALRHTAFHRESLFVFQKGPVTVHIEMTPDRPYSPAQNPEKAIHHISRDASLLERDHLFSLGKILNTFEGIKYEEGSPFWNPDEDGPGESTRVVIVTFEAPIYNLLARIMYSFEHPKYSVLYMDFVKKTIGVSPSLDGIDMTQGTPGQMVFFVLKDEPMDALSWEKETEGNLYIEFPVFNPLRDLGSASISFWQDCPIITMNAAAWKYATQELAQLAYMTRAGMSTPDNPVEWFVSGSWGPNGIAADGDPGSLSMSFYEAGTSSPGYSSQPGETGS